MTTGQAQPLYALAEDFWRWRVRQMPRSSDDIPRVDRPPGWVPDWSRGAVTAGRAALADFRGRLRALDLSGADVTEQVDATLVGSALARVGWELDVLRGWERDPGFYVDQTLGTVFDALLQPPPLDRSRGEDLVTRMEAIPSTLAHARGNLGDDTVGPFAALAVTALEAVDARLATVLDELDGVLADDQLDRLRKATAPAAAALSDYAQWLRLRLPSLRRDTAVGRDAFVGFLRDVALLPFTPERLLEMGRQEWERAVAFEAIARRRTAGLDEPALAGDQAAQIAREREDEVAVRAFYERQGLLSQPASLRHYRTLPLPGYLAPLASLGVTDDLTSPARLDADGVSYVPEPHPGLGYFQLANARDPRLGIVHEGVHYQQLTLAWAHSNPVRRHYYDSGPNEGIAFYNEELMLQAGLFDDDPHSRQTICNFMRLRALRVEVDVRLALGDLDVDTAARHLAERVPMDVATATEEAAFFAATPGQALTYQIGKLQIMSLLADAALAAGDDFVLADFHDYLWRNGNVPLSLLRWEHLGDRRDVDALAVLR